MISRFLPITKGDTVLNYYALPLVGLNRKYFGSNLISTKLNKSGTVVFVHLQSDIYSDTIFANKLHIDSGFYIFERVKEKYIGDMLKIIKGKYSTLSADAKTVIKEKSGLLNGHLNSNGNRYTSKLILALDRDKTLLNYMFEALKVSDKKSDELYAALNTAELMEKVSDEDFI